MDSITFGWTLAATFFAGIHLFVQKIVANDTFFTDVAAHDDGILGHGGAKLE